MNTGPIFVLRVCADVTRCSRACSVSFLLSRRTPVVLHGLPLRVPSQPFLFLRLPHYPPHARHPSTASTMARKVSIALLTVLCLFLLGTAVVLSTTKAYLKIDDWAYITEVEVPYSPPRLNASRSEEIVPRILHQTWKTDVLPDRWVAPSQHCRDMMPD